VQVHFPSDFSWSI